ncbi:MAG: hypothetical protein ACFKPT_02505 [Gloeotrichia echinulata GP01]
MQTTTYALVMPTAGCAYAILYEIYSEIISLKTFVSTSTEHSPLWDENIVKRLDSIEAKIQLVKNLIG